MKKLFRITVCILALVCLISVCAFADGEPAAETKGGLGAFDTIANMSTYTFPDLVSNHWAYAGIKLCYDRGILVGYPDGSFAADENITWAQAITVAARIHSIYYNEQLSDIMSESDLWFKPYYDYCSLHGLIPSGAPQYAKLDKTDINRYDLAYIFSRTIASKDLAPVSDLNIPDLASIPSKYVSSVKQMYAAGIMNGMDRNAFDGSSYATRAQIAEVIARLLVPSERVGHDIRANSDMAAFEANLENDSVAVQVGKRYFCIYKTYTGPQTEQFALYSNDPITGSFSPIYTCDAGDYLSNLSVYDGKVYFCRSTSGSASGSLLSFDPDTEKISIVYSGFIVESYCFYDGVIYALMFTSYSETVDGYYYAFGTIEKGVFNSVKTGMNYYEVKYFVPYGWDNCIYFKLSSKEGPTQLYKYDLQTKMITLVLNANINTSFFDGHVMYYLVFDPDGAYDLNLYGISLSVPDAVCTYGKFPAPTTSKFRSLYKFGDDFYCLSAFSRNVYAMDKTGAYRIALITGGVYNAMCFTSDKVVLIPNTLVTSNANEVNIYNSKTLSAKCLYGDWLGLSCYYEGRHFAPAENQVVLSSTESVSSVSKLLITVPEAFYNGKDFVMLTKFQNETDETIKIRSYVVYLAVNIDGRQVIAAQNINRMSGYELKKHSIQTFTFVIGENDIGIPFDPAVDQMSIYIVPTYDIVPKAQK